MSYTVDIELNLHILELVERIFDSQVNLLTNLLNDSSIVSNTQNSNLFTVLFKIIEPAILRKLESKIHESSSTGFQLSSDDLFHEGSGSIRINNPPSKAQEKLVDSLLKVLFSQFVSVAKNNHTDNGHDNLILSLFIENIFVEPYNAKASDLLNMSHGSLDEIVNKIFQKTNVQETIKKNDSFSLYKLELYFYHFKVEGNNSSKEALVEEFDKIDLSDNVSDRTLIDETNKKIPLFKEILPNFQFSQETLNLVSITTLPSPQLEGLWESLFYNSTLKQAIFNSAVLSLKISQQRGDTEQQRKSNEQILNNNGLLLLHGPPGTGKTSLCRAVCQKLSIRQKYNRKSLNLNERSHSILVELSCSRIFSRWFGESSKNISCVFNDIELLLQSRGNDTGFVCLLIDEVETIASCRTKAINNNESNESVRVVNSLLTNLDKLKKHDNFIVLTTSNYIDTLDCAFIDRADRIFHVTKPSLEALENILISSIENLMYCNILIPTYRKGKLLENCKYKNVIRTIAKHCLVCIKLYHLLLLSILCRTN